MTAAHARRRRRIAVGVLLLAEVLLWGLTFGVAGLFRDGPNGKSMATDFAVFSAAAMLLKEGGNPYDNRALYRSEVRLMHRERLPVTTNGRNVRAGNPPLMYWLLEPTLRLRFVTAAWLWMGLMTVLSAGAFLLLLRWADWTALWAPLAAFLFMPQVVLGVGYANVHAAVLLALVAGLAFVRRHPALAGVVLALSLLKPHLAIPLIALIVLCRAPRRTPVVVGLALTTLAAIVLTVAIAGPGSLPDWVRGTVDWSSGVAREPNLASLVGLYVNWAPGALRLVFEVLSLLVAAGITAYLVRRRGTWAVPDADFALLWIVWFLATPFAHYPDEIVLAVPFVILLGRDGARIANLRVAGAVALTFLSIFFFATALLSLLVIAAAVLLYPVEQERPLMAAA